MSMVTKIIEPNRLLSQYFTPKCVVDFGWALLRGFGVNDLTDCRIIDPAAGAGVWLNPILNGRERCSGAIHGIEIDKRWKGIGEVRHVGDALWSNFPGVEDSSFDVVVGNPPFGRLSRFLSILDKRYKDSTSAKFEVINNFGQNMRSCPIELLFLERALQLAMPGGWIIQVLPDSFFANTVYQKVRDWFLDRMDLRCIVKLPNSIFRSNRLNVQTCILLARRPQKTRRNSDYRVRMIRPRHTVHRKDLDGYFEDSLKGRARKVNHFTLKSSSLSGRRWDPGYWSGSKILEMLKYNFELMPLGDFVEHLTYGPIVTGRKMEHVDVGRPVVRQGDIAETGLLHKQLMRVEFEGEFDPERSRVRKGDFLLARSGTGSLGKNRMVVYTGREQANVGCFVDLVRLVGVNSFFVWFFFKTRYGRSQIFSVANGVGTPNINFSEIRALLIPKLNSETQRALENRYRTQVLPLHRRQSKTTVSKFDKIISQLELYLSGELNERNLLV
jgi:type I restriction enzyme M protein